MSDTVAHYLGIYRQRQRMAVSGVIKPSVESRALIDQLVTCLSDLNPNLPCHLSTTKNSDGNVWTAFVVEGKELVKHKFSAELDT